MCAAFVGPRERESRTPIRGHVHGHQINNFKGEKPWKPDVMNQPPAAACRLRYPPLAFAPRSLPPTCRVGVGTARGGRLTIECAEIARDAANGFEQQRREALGLRVVEA
jgi:hypothetical protein